jgi:hypothetical protein
VKSAAPAAQEGGIGGGLCEEVVIMNIARPDPGEKKKVKIFDVVSPIAGSLSMVAAGNCTATLTMGLVRNATCKCSLVFPSKSCRLGFSQAAVNLTAALGVLGFSLTAFPLSLLHEVVGLKYKC